MSSLDPFLLARMQFAANITFHIRIRHRLEGACGEPE